MVSIFSHKIVQPVRKSHAQSELYAATLINKMEWHSSSPDLNPIEQLWDQFGRAVHVKATHTTTLADSQKGYVRCHLT